jgi:hypothetical protein
MKGKTRNSRGEKETWGAGREMLTDILLWTLRLFPHPNILSKLTKLLISSLFLTFLKTFPIPKREENSVSFILINWNSI